MKRILLSVFAVAITAAWALPTTATASEVTLSGHYRLRGEYRNQNDYNKSVNDHTDFWGQRVRITANAKATDDTSVKITLQDTRNWGMANTAAGTGTGSAAAGATGATQGTTGTDTGNTLDLHESYMNVEKLFGAPVSFRAGRQEFNYGDQRLIGSFGWSNNGRSFDALKFTVSQEQFNVDLFASKLNDTAVTAKDQDLYGIYATVKAIPSNTLDVYYLSLRDNRDVTAMVTNNTTNATITATGAFTKTQVLNTYGLRLKGGMMGIDYTAEFANQSGQMTTSTTKYKIGARAYAVKVGYTLTAPVKIRIGYEYDYASGDKDSTDAKIQTFSNLFPTNHGHYGFMDQQGWRNVKAHNINAKASVTDTVSVSLSYWIFKLAQKQDAWYNAGQWNQTAGGTLRGASATNTSSSVGSEIDLGVNYKYNSSVGIEFGYGQFKAGKFVKNNVTNAGGQKADSTFSYLQVVSNF